MNATHTDAAPVSLDDWLTALISASPEELRMCAIRGMAAGMAMEKVRCSLHSRTLSFVGAYRHLADTEQVWREQHTEDGDNAALHKIGDLHPASPGDNPAALFWSTSPCRACGAEVVWALTPRGKHAPIDADPDPAGHVLLVAQPSVTDPPRALYLHSDEQRAELPEGRLHTPHHATCPGPEKKRPRR